MRQFYTGLSLAALIAGTVHGAPLPDGGKDRDKTPDTVNYVLGTQTFGIRYQFTKETSLVETARRIRNMGSNLLKFNMSPRTLGGHYSTPRRPDIRSLVDLAVKEPSVKAVLDMPFAYYHLWVYPFAHKDAAWADGLSDTERKEAYREVHDLAVHVLRQYDGQGKTFLFGHWEGDWHLHPNYNARIDPSPVAIQGMIDWLNVRQQAIEDARRQQSDSDVGLYQYTEVNLVQKAIKGGRCLVNDVLPHASVDYVSYSCYDTLYPHKGNTAKALVEALEYIESKLPAKKGIRGKRVFLGEFGFPLDVAKSPEQQDDYAREVCRAAIQWGCPYVLYWQIYCNEKRKDGKGHRGFWLINDRNRKQPFYHTLKAYYQTMSDYVAGYRAEHGKPPPDELLRAHAVEVLDKKP